MKKVLFAAESVYQLFNAIILRMTEKENDECDLILSEATVWPSDIISNLKGIHLFDKIVFPETKKQEWDFWDLDQEKRYEVYRNPKAFFSCGYPVEPVYDELFFPIDHIFWKMIYNYEVSNGRVPDIYMYDEGVRAYTMELSKTDDKPFSKDAYNPSFVNSIKAYYLHQPQLYSLTEYPYELKKIQNPTNNEKLRQAIQAVYGFESAPNEKYIYMEDFFFADHLIGNDFDLFKKITQIIGKDNIIVKRHPRDKFDRFTPWGVNTMQKNVIPWEVQLLLNDYSEKVLVSVSSTSILTPFLIFESNQHVIMLDKLFVGDNPTHSDRGYNKFIYNTLNWVNEKKDFIHRPSTLEELEEVLHYIDLDIFIQKNE